ncbi:MAG: hypothetical protein ABIZ80_18195 [Bryobacteraceae bacterium]
MRRHILLVLAASLVFVSACSEAPKVSEKKKEPEPPAEPVSGSSAFFKMYTAARGWAGDVQGLQMISIHLPEVKSVPGKSGAWRVMFVSQSMKRARTYTYSVMEADGNLHKGVFAGNDESWSGPKGMAKPFLIQALKIDSDAAYQTAVKKGKSAAEYIKKNPDMNVAFLLEQTNRFPSLTWRVIWGESVGTSNYSVYVDASTGEYLETMR